MSEILNNWIVVINDWIWTYILIIFLIAAGLYLVFKAVLYNSVISGKCSVYWDKG